MSKKVDLLVDEFRKIKMPAVKAKYMPPPKKEESKKVDLLVEEFHKIKMPAV